MFASPIAPASGEMLISVPKPPESDEIDSIISSQPASPISAQSSPAEHHLSLVTPMPLQPTLVFRSSDGGEKSSPTPSSAEAKSSPFKRRSSPPSVADGHVAATAGENCGLNLLAGQYILMDHLEGSHLQRCADVRTGQEFVCKTVRNDPGGNSMLTAHSRVDGHPHVNPVQRVIVGDKFSYLLFPPCSTDLHSYVRTRRRLREPHARLLFRQIVAAVHESHSRGLVLRDLKLRKFVFTDETRTTLRLESLEDAVVLDTDNDLLSDKHGCPAYVSPEILRTNSQYSGRAADMWGLGVMLYTMLVGRYPFHGQEHTGLFAKIRRGQFSLPDNISSRARCLIRCLLRKDPANRLTTEDVLIHPWVTMLTPSSSSTSSCYSRESRRSSSSSNNNNNNNNSVSTTSSSSSSASAGNQLTPQITSYPGSSGHQFASSSSHHGPSSGFEPMDQQVPEFFPPDDVDSPSFKY